MVGDATKVAACLLDGDCRPIEHADADIPWNAACQSVHWCPTFLPTCCCVPALSGLCLQIYNHVASGFADSNPYLRELTLKSLAVLGPKLSQKTLNQSLLKHLAKLQVGRLWVLLPSYSLGASNRLNCTRR